MPSIRNMWLSNKNYSKFLELGPASCPRTVLQPCLHLRYICSSPRRIVGRRESPQIPNPGLGVRYPDRVNFIVVWELRDILHEEWSFSEPNVPIASRQHMYSSDGSVRKAKFAVTRRPLNLSIYLWECGQLEQFFLHHYQQSSLQFLSPKSTIP